jgi:hypothetical protein
MSGGVARYLLRTLLSHHGRKRGIFVLAGNKCASEPIAMDAHHAQAPVVGSWNDERLL